jgi:Tfp pilus assembly protein PilF
MKILILILFFPLNNCFSQDVFSEGLSLYYDSDEYIKSIEFLTLSIKNGDSICEAYKFIGANYIQLNDFNKAEYNLLKSIKCDSSDFMTYTFYARTLGYLGEYDKAIKFYSKSIKLNPRYYNNYIEVSLCQKEILDYNSAKTNIGIAINIDSLDEESYGILGSIQIQLLEFNLARKSFEKSISLKENGSNYSGLGESLDILNDYKGAIIAYSNALKYEDAVKDLIYYSRGIVYLKLLDYDKACSDFEKSFILGNQMAKVKLEYCRNR